MANWLVERLDHSHERGEFRCGKALLDQFLHALVSQYEKRKLGRTYVAVWPGEKRVYGYYTLASGAMSFQSLPAKAAKKLPRHPVPVALLARLAVDLSMQGSGLGKHLLMDALKRCLDLSSQLGIHAVEVDAIDAAAQTFYEKYGFIVLEDKEGHLYLPLATIEATLERKPNFLLGAAPCLRPIPLGGRKMGRSSFQNELRPIYPAPFIRPVGHSNGDC